MGETTVSRCVYYIYVSTITMAFPSCSMGPGRFFCLPQVTVLITHTHKHTIWKCFLDYNSFNEILLIYSDTSENSYKL